MEKIVNKYEAGLEISENFETDYPLLHSAFIYNDCIVRLMGYATLDSIESVEVGYSLAGGKFAKYGQNGKLELGFDRTVAYLLAGINYYLDMPFNDFFIILIWIEDSAHLLMNFLVLRSGTRAKFKGKDAV
jgi:hypothetical protein